ncbi:MAG: alpha/beta hydrolase [Cyclobacteriaceae bacterium]|nr:alpha/beta hydrolase [Cyclobacteriaceae bacterium]
MTTKILIGLLLTISFNLLGQKIEYSLSIPGDTTQNYYVTVYPKDKIKGAIVLLPGFGELPKQILIESDIYKYTSNAGYLTIIPALGDRSFFYIDNPSHEKLNQFVDEMFKKYNLNESTFFIGGHSFGGTMAVQYAQRAYLEKSTLKKPAGVFATDPPLDIERLYGCMTTTNRPTKNPVSVQEDNYISNRIKLEFNNDPKTNPEFFWNVSPYSQSDPEHRSLKTFLTVPVRIYNEPDINWYLDNRNLDFYCINSLDSAAMINWLRSLGNSKAELIISTNKGYRVTQKRRHPHSWSIIDGQELIGWITKTTIKKG